MINNLKTEYNSDFLSTIFSNKIIVCEDLPGSSIKLERDSIDAPWFLMKPGGRRISEVDRTLMIFYNYIYNHIFNRNLSLIDDSIQSIYFTYVYRDNIESVTYPSLPESKLIISHMVDFNGEEITNISINQQHAGILDVGSPAVIFNGKLNKPKREKVLDAIYSSSNNKEVVKKIISILKPELSARIHNLGSIHNIIFKTEDTKFFARLFKFDKQDNSTEDDYYIQIVIDFVNFIHSKDLFRYKISGSNYNQLYINLISKIFNQFIEQRGHLFDDLEFNKPDFMKHDSFQISKRFINDLDTIEYLNNKTYQEIFKIVLNAFKKEKSKNHGAFNTRIREYFNQCVKSIKNRINKSLVNESSHESIKSYYEVVNESKVVVKDTFNPFTINKISKLAYLYEQYQKPIYLQIQNGDDLTTQMALDVIQEHFYLNDIINTSDISESDIKIKLNNVNDVKNVNDSLQVPKILHKYLK